MIDFGTIITDLKGEPMKDGDITITLGYIATSALTNIPTGENPSGKEKFDRFLLATKCDGQVELKAEEIALIKDMIGKLCPPLIVGRSWQLLDRAEQQEA